MGKTEHIQKENAPDIEITLTKTVDVEVDNTEELEVYVKNGTSKTNEEKDSQHIMQGPYMPLLSCLFLAVDEFDTSGILSRKYYTTAADPFLIERNLSAPHQIQELFPEKYGFHVQNPSGNLSVVDHVRGINKQNSPYISASEVVPDGASNINGKVIYIDIETLERSGAKLISTDEIIKLLTDYKEKYPDQASKIDPLITTIRETEKEVTILPKNGEISPKALITPSELNLALKIQRVGRVVKVIGIVVTAYDLGNAGLKSLEQNSVKPITAEAIRQAGGWGGTVAGAAVGAKLLGTGGALAGSVFPGAGTAVGGFIGGVIGGIIGGAAGYFGADWIADEIDEN